MTTDDEARAQQEQWLAEDRERRLKAFYDRRPAAFAVRGSLHAGIHAWLETFVAGEPRTLLLGGPTGTGKSWSTWKAVETLLVNGWRHGWEIIGAYELSRLLAPPVDADHLERLTRTGLLVVDDMGSIRVTDWAVDHLLGLVDYRWSHRLPMLITTNTPKLGEAVGERIASRLADGATSIILDGADRRRAS